MPVTLSALRVVFVLTVSLGLSSLLFGSQAGLIGHWNGTMVREGARLEVSFDFIPSGTQPKGTFTSLTQQAMDYPLALVTANGDMVHFVLGDSLVFDGKLSANEITGTFTDDGAKGDFTLRRTEPPILPYDSVDVTFHNGAVTLAGTLCVPRSSGRHPAVVLLQGSGGETRWGTNRFIADRFARSGIRQHLYGRARLELGIELQQFPDLGQGNKKEKDGGFAEQIEERNPTLASIVDLCVATRNGVPVPRPRVSAVLTYNIDALLQNYDRALHSTPRMFRTIERASKRRHPRKVPLYHLHGLIQPERTSEASETAESLVLCEDDYNARTDDPYSFANTTMQWALRDFLCVFIGCSLNDELMRRALYRAKQEQRKALFVGARNPKDEEPRHFAVMQYDVHHDLREKDSRLLQVGPLWVADFGRELSERLAGLRDVLDS